MTDSYRGDKSRSKSSSKSHDIPGSVAVDDDTASQNITDSTVRELFGMALQSLPYPICMIDAEDYTVKLANSAAAIDLSAPIQKCYRALHQKSSPCHEDGEPCPVRIVKSTKMPTVVEHIHTDQNGAQKYFEVHGYPVFGDDGQVVSIIEYSLDVTERRRAEEALKESEARWRSVMQHAPDVIFMVDSNGGILFVNRLEGGSSVEEAIGKSIYDFIPPSNRELVQKTIDAVFKTGQPDRYEISTPGSDGTTAWHSTRLAPVLGEDGVNSVILITRDISERKLSEDLLRSAHRDLESRVAERTTELQRANEQLKREIREREQVQTALKESEERHRVILNNMSDAVFVCDDHGKLIWVGPNAASFFGLSPDDLSGITQMEELLGPDLFERSQLDEQGELSDLRRTILNQNGQARTVLVSIKSAGIKGGTTLYSCRDITRLDQVKQALRTVNEELKLERQTLWQKNTALKEILGQIEDEKKRMASQIHININRVALPILNALTEKVQGEGQYFVSLLKSTLVDLTSPFVGNLEKTCPNLTPREHEICQMIKSGLTSKEIASSHHNSVETVLKQRKSIRRKLGISGKDVNLVTYLKSLDRD